MVTPKHTAFIDLEESLARRLKTSWSKQSADLLRFLKSAITRGDYLEAERLAHEIDLQVVAEDNDKTLATIGLAALYLGVSRVTPIRQSATFKDPPTTLLNSARDQAQVTIGRDGTKQVQTLALEAIHDAQVITRDKTFTSSHEDDQSYDPTIAPGLAAVALIAAVRGAKSIEEAQALAGDAVKDMIYRSGVQITDLTSNLYVSRLNTLGFLDEATNAGYTLYEINEILDDKICAVCEEMHGQQFSVADGILHTEAILSNDDPQVGKVLAPWPSRSDSSIEHLQSATTEQLVNEGLATPPYHAGCRGIVILVE